MKKQMWFLNFTCETRVLFCKEGAGALRVGTWTRNRSKNRILSGQGRSKTVGSRISQKRYLQGREKVLSNFTNFQYWCAMVLFWLLRRGIETQALRVPRKHLYQYNMCALIWWQWSFNTLSSEFKKSKKIQGSYFLYFLYFHIATFPGKCVKYIETWLRALLFNCLLPKTDSSFISWIFQWAAPIIPPCLIPF